MPPSEAVAFPDLLTVDQAADRLRVSTATVGRLIRRGELPALRVGGQYRVDSEQLLAWLRTTSNGTNGNPQPLTRTHA